MMARYIALVCLFSGVAAFGQVPIELDESCTVTVGNQTVFVRPDGTFLVRNISVFRSRTTGIAPQLYRVRATCLRDGEAITGQSEFFELTPGQTTFIADVLPSELDPIPLRISVSAPTNVLPLGATAQLIVTARLPDNSQEDVTPRSEGTTYLSTNSRVLTVSEDGLVTGANTSTRIQRGTIAVLNEGNVATINFTAQGASNDFDNDGMPNDYEDLFGLNKFVNDANGDLDNDGLTNIAEFNLGTIPNNPDTDGDDVNDGQDCAPLVPENAPPTVEIVSPADGATLIEGQTVQFSVNANDDSVLASVELSTDTGFSQAFPNPGCNASLQADIVIPEGVDEVVFTATATDGIPNQAEEVVVLRVIPDPLTTVIGVVVDPDNNPVEGAELSTNGDVTGVSLGDGSFSLPNVPTILGDIVVTASAVVGDTELTGQSSGTPRVPGGITDVGQFAVFPFDPIVIGPTTFPLGIMAFPTHVEQISGSPPFAFGGVTAEEGLTGADLDTGAFNLRFSQVFRLEFDRPIVNQPGDDIYLTDSRFSADALGVAFCLSDGSPFVTIPAGDFFDTGVDSTIRNTGFRFNLFAATLDMSNFGFELGESISCLWIRGVSQSDPIVVGNLNNP